MHWAPVVVVGIILTIVGVIPWIYLWKGLGLTGWAFFGRVAISSVVSLIGGLAAVCAMMASGVSQRGWLIWTIPVYFVYFCINTVISGQWHIQLPPRPPTRPRTV